jgi:hypothetical protein
MNHLRKSGSRTPKFNHLGGAANVGAQCMSHTVRLMASLLSGKETIEINIEKWPKARPLVGTERVGAWVDVHHTGESVLTLLEGLGHHVCDPRTFWRVTPNTGDNGNTGRTWATAAKTPANDGELIP